MILCLCRHDKVLIVLSVLIRQQREAVIYLMTHLSLMTLMKKGEMMPLQSTSALSETKPFFQ